MIKKIDKFVNQIFSSKDERLRVISKLEKSTKSTFIAFVLLSILYCVSIFLTDSYNSTSSVVLCMMGIGYAMNTTMLYISKVVDRLKDEMESSVNKTSQTKSEQSA